MLEHNNNMARIVKKGFKVYSIGNSRGIYLDKDTCEYLGIDVGDWIEVTIEKAPKKEETEKKKKE